jgi:hypothetical protein
MNEKRGWKITMGRNPLIIIIIIITTIFYFYTSYVVLFIFYSQFTVTPCFYSKFINKSTQEVFSNNGNTSDRENRTPQREIGKVTTHSNSSENTRNLIFWFSLFIKYVYMSDRWCCHACNQCIRCRCPWNVVDCMGAMTVVVVIKTQRHNMEKWQWWMMCLLSSNFEGPRGWSNDENVIFFFVQRRLSRSVGMVYSLLTSRSDIIF